MDYDGYCKRAFNEVTEFERMFPKTYVNKVKSSYLTGSHIIKLDDVTKVCKKRKISYSQYQQLESLYFAKLDYKYK